MQTRLIDNEKDYATIAQWWALHGWPAVPKQILPKCGVMVYDERTGRGLSAAWLYMDNSIGVAMMEWAVTNAGNTARESYLAIAMLVQAVRELALTFDYGVLLTSCKQEALAKVYERNGFRKTDSGMTHLVMLTKE